MWSWKINSSIEIIDLRDLKFVEECRKNQSISRVRVIKESQHLSFGVWALEFTE